MMGSFEGRDSRGRLLSDDTGGERSSPSSAICSFPAVRDRKTGGGICQGAALPRIVPQADTSSSAAAWPRPVPCPSFGHCGADTPQGAQANPTTP